MTEGDLYVSACAALSLVCSKTYSFPFSLSISYQWCSNAQGSWESARVVPTGEFEDMKCDLVSPSFAISSIVLAVIVR